MLALELQWRETTMGEMIRFSCPGGGQAEGYLAKATEPKVGVIVIQEWWGLNEQIKGVAERFAAAGYSALAPDLYRGRVTTEPDEANHLMEGLDWVGATEEEVRGAAQFLKASCAQVAVSMGSPHTPASSNRVRQASARAFWSSL